MTRTWYVSSITDAAQARIATARLAAACGVPPSSAPAWSPRSPHS